MFRTITVAGHVDNLAVMNKAVRNGSGDGRVAEEIGPFVKSLDGTLKAKIEAVERLNPRKIGALATDKVLLFRAESLLLRKERFHAFQRSQAVMALKKGVKIYKGQMEIVGALQTKVKP